MKKRILSILLLFCMVLTLLPTTAFAADESPAVTNVTVTFDSNGGGEVESQTIQQGQQVQRPADPIKDGYAFIGWYNKADLQYINLPEWNFDYPVFENMELVAQWMEARPISTDPITYLDKDGNQQVCTAYTVLTSETKASILDYADKWYDLPAGWYVVEGNVTITPRLDTHGAVNLILTNGSHLTAEWGIDVKVGDTFTVYAQSTDEGTMGRLTACLPADFNLDRMVHYSVWPDSGMAGIGSSARWREGNDGIRESEGTIVINGGNIRAKGQDNASAIGGTRAEEIEFRSTDRGEVYNRRQGGSITINGGVVRTEAFAMSVGNCTTVESVGIGTCQMGYGGSVTINGGTVIAEATCDAITTGYGGTITINGGDVTAIGGVNNFAEDLNRVIPGNGIGPYESGSVTINDGTVKATAKGEGFGIGGARIYNTGAMTVTINGGTIEATANRNNAAIGDRGKGKSGVTITDGVIHATGKGGAAGIGSKDDIRITGGELTVSAEGSGAAIGGFTDSHSERVNCKSITINGNVIQSISSKDGACIGGAAGGSVGRITVSDAELPLLSSNKILIGWDADSPGGKLTIRNCRVASTDTLSVLTDGIRVGSNSELVIEESEIRLPHLRGIRVGGNGSIAVRDSDLHTYGIFMDETVHTITDAKTLKKLEITDSTVLTGDIIGARGEYASVEEIVIRGSSIRLNEEYPYNRCTIGGGEQASFGSIDIQDSQIDITSSLNAPIGSGLRSSTDRESRIRIANSQVSVRNLKFGPAIGSGYTSHGGRMDIIIENSTVTAKGGDLRSSTDYIPGIGKNASGCNTVIGIQILNSTVDSFRLREKGDTDYVYDDLHTQELPGIPAENISICGSTVNRKTIDHSFDEYGKCTLCGKYDLGYCYEHGLLTMEGLTDCVSDGSEKKLTGLSHKTGENETKQLAENTDYTASYSNNVHPYTLTPDDEGFDSEKAPKVTLYGMGNYCGKAEHYFTISENAAAAPSITTSSLPDGKVGEVYSQILTATGTTPIKWSISGALPDGLTLDETTGKISGTPTADGTAKFTVKAENSVGSDTKELSITITKDAPAEFTISVKTDGNGTASASLAKAAANTEITLSATPNEGYHFKEWEVESPTGLVITNNKFTMPEGNVEVKAIFEEDVPAPTEFTITVKTDSNGTASASPDKAVAGTEIALTATPNGGYHFKEWQVESPAGLVITNNQFTMPNDSVEVKAIFEKDAPPAPTEFTVIFDGNGGTPSVGSMTTTDQKLTSLPSASRSGSYSFDGWYTEKSGGTKITTATVFSAKTTVYAHWTYTGGGGGGYNPPVTYYTLRFETGGGSDIPSVREAYNTYIDLTKYVPTWRGHTFIGWYTERSLMNKVSGVYLTKDMTVYAGWRVDENPGTGANPFTDVSEKDWFYGDVMFVYENGLMLGTSKTLFSPHGTATRGMMATILWRMEGSPAPKGKNSFTDVEAGKWYADAITWTAENGIFAGYGKDKFGPDDPITREQLAAIFYRYADYKGYDLTVKGNLDKFKDADKITDYAKTAMQWAVGSGLVKGKSGNLLDPQGTATRAEIAAMLHRFIEKYELVQGKAPGGLMGWIDPKRLQIPKTGDSSVLGLWGISLCTSLAGCLVLTTWQIRRRREEESLQIIEK